MTFFGLRQKINEEFNLKNLDFNISVNTNDIKIVAEREENLPISQMEEENLKDKYGE